jgi:hypothetical protein
VTGLLSAAANNRFVFAVQHCNLRCLAGLLGLAAMAGGSCDWLGGSDGELEEDPLEFLEVLEVKFNLSLSIGMMCNCAVLV